MGIFATHAAKYHDMGMAVIPLAGKEPIHSGWRAWSEREQTAEELDALVTRYPNANIGAVLGRWACALDIDTEDSRILTAAPYSPLRRRGAKGFVALYRPCASPNVPGTDYPVEFLNHGRQIVLPPSIHPDCAACGAKKTVVMRTHCSACDAAGTQYTWTGEDDIFSTLPHELALFAPSDMERLQKLCERLGIKSRKRTQRLDGEHPVDLADTGRNNRLTAIAYAMACDDVPVDEATKRLLELDKKEHAAPWFSDPSEPHKGKNPAQTARRFYERALAKAEAKGERLGPITVNINTNDSPKATRNHPQPLASTSGPIPQPRGLIRLFQEYCQATAFGDQSVLGLGGGLALMAAIASNRFRTQAGTFSVYPNLYVMNLAHSGFGKEASQRALDEILMGTGLLGSASYKSGSSIVLGLAEQPQRLDIIDECAMILKAMGSREDYKADIVDVLSSLYSKSSTYFHGFTSVANGRSFGACWNPCVNLLGSTTPAGFRGSVSKDMAAKGLLPRFLIFWQQEVGEFKRDLDPLKSARLMHEIRRLVGVHLATPLRPLDGDQTNLLEPATTSTRYDPVVLPMSDGAQRAILDIQEHYFNEGKLDPEGFESAFRNRFAQHVAKLALLDALGLGLAEIGVDSVEWAHAVVTWQWLAVRPLYELASAENPHEKDVLEVMQYIKAKGHVKRGQLGRRFSRVPKFRLDDIIKGLETSECIMASKHAPEGLGRPFISYEFVKDVRTDH